MYTRRNALKVNHPKDVSGNTEWSESLRESVTVKRMMHGGINAISQERGFTHLFLPKPKTRKEK